MDILSPPSQGQQGVYRGSTGHGCTHSPGRFYSGPPRCPLRSSHPQTCIPLHCTPCGRAFPFLHPHPSHSEAPWGGLQPLALPACSTFQRCFCSTLSIAEFHPSHARPWEGLQAKRTRACLPSLEFGFPVRAGGWKVHHSLKDQRMGRRLANVGRNQSPVGT